MEKKFEKIWKKFPKINYGRENEKDYQPAQTGPLEIIEIAKALYDLYSKDIGGDILECGCFFGYSSSCLSWACHYLGHRLIVADSFQGLPHEGGQDYYKMHDFKADLDIVRNNIAKFGKINCVDFIPGWFNESLKGFSRPISVLWMDVDLESSTLDVLNNTFNQLVPGGIIFSHEIGQDYFQDGKFQYVGGPAEAIHNFLTERKILYSGKYLTGCLGEVGSFKSFIPLPFKYQGGWYPAETDDNIKIDKWKNWRWTGKVATCSLQNVNKPSTFILIGAINPYSQASQSIKIFVNNKQIDKFAPGNIRFYKAYQIEDPASNSQPFILKIEVNKTFQPKKFEQSCNDIRELGIQVFEVSWGFHTEFKSSLIQNHGN